MLFPLCTPDARLFLRCKARLFVAQLEVSISYLNDVQEGKNTMSDERNFKIARLLNTTYEYLTDATDDSSPDYKGRTAESAEDRLIRTVTERVKTLSSEQIGILQVIFEDTPEHFDKSLAVWKAMKG